MAKRKSKSHNWCEFGNHTIERDEEGRRVAHHVYPVPAHPKFPDGGTPGQGATSCEKHLKGVRKLQVEQGLLLVE